MPRPSTHLIACGVALAFFAGTSSSARAQQAEAMHHDHVEAKPSTSLTVHAGDRTLTLSLADLQAMPQVSVSVYNGHSKQNETYSGPLVADVLAKTGITLTEQTEHSILDSYITAEGTDGYFVVFSGAELQPGLHKAQAIVAVAQSGQPLTRAGAFQLVDTLELKPARWVRNLTALSVHPVEHEH